MTSTPSESSSIDWQLGHAPKQSITELLHNPRGSVLQMPDVSLDLPALTLVPTAPLPLPPAYDINHFEAYLRRYTPLYQKYQSSSLPENTEVAELSSVPKQYFESGFTIAADQHLSSLQSYSAPLSSHPELANIQSQLSSHQSTLQQHLTTTLSSSHSVIIDSLSQLSNLRDEISATTTAISTTQSRAKALIPRILSPIQSIRKLTILQNNLTSLKRAVRDIQTCLSAPNDIAILIDASEYEAAIITANSAREKLKQPHLTSVKALQPLHEKLKKSVNHIDSALRHRFQDGLVEGNRQFCDDIVPMIAQLGTLTKLYRTCMRGIKKELTARLKTVNSFVNATKVATELGQRAVMLVDIVSEADAPLAGRDLRAEYLRDAHADVEELLTETVERILRGESESTEKDAYVVITEPGDLTELTCFDEFKAALKFGEQMRSVEQLASDMEKLFQGERRRGTLRAKISERHISFLSTFHKAHMEALSTSIKSDRWQEIKVSEGVLKLLAAVMGPSQSANGVSNGITSNGNSETVQSRIVIDGQTYKTVASGVRYVRSMCAYTLLAERSPRHASEIARRGADYCRQFNSLIGKAILGANALQWSGLRSITARHLSLASRTIAMAVNLAKHCNSSFMKALEGPQKSVTMPLIANSERDFREHHSQLLAKILSIMMERLQAHELALRRLPWDKSQEMARFKLPSPYISTLAKEATVLHRILWSMLPGDEVLDIFDRVCTAYGTHLSDAYGSLDGGKKWVRTRVAKDVAELHQVLSGLDVFKQHPNAFKPVMELYKRFSKEVLEEESRKAAEASKREKERKLAESRRVQQKPENRSQPVDVVPEKDTKVVAPNAKPDSTTESKSQTVVESTAKAIPTDVKRGGEMKTESNAKPQPISDSTTDTPRDTQALVSTPEKEGAKPDSAEPEETKVVKDAANVEQEQNQELDGESANGVTRDENESEDTNGEQSRPESSASAGNLGNVVKTEEESKSKSEAENASEASTQPAGSGNESAVVDQSKGENNNSVDNSLNDESKEESTTEKNKEN